MNEILHNGIYRNETRNDNLRQSLEDIVTYLDLPSTFQKVNEASSILSKEHKCETAVIVCVLLRIAGFISNYVYVLLEDSVNQYNSE